METSIGIALGGLGSLVTAPLRAYLTQLMRDQLTHYVREDCMNWERLTLGGTLTLQNLELKLDVLRDTLKIPLTFEITRGFVRKLQVHVPWTNLLGQPITAKIDTVMIVVRMKTDEELKRTAEATAEATADGTSSASEGVSEAPGRRIEAANAPATRSDTATADTTTEEGWITGLVKRVVANASISVKDFIFKFDDGDGRVLTATLNSLNIFSADPRNRWSVSSFFEPEGPQKRVCKAAVASGLSIRLDHSTSSSTSSSTPSNNTFSNFSTPLPKNMTGVDDDGKAENKRRRRKHEHEVPVLRRANISVRGWFSLAPIHANANLEEHRSMEGGIKKDENFDQTKGPFSGYSGWHNGREEVRGHPSSVIDIHCTRLCFALSETQVDIMMKISERTSEASKVLSNLMERVKKEKKKELKRQKNRNQDNKMRENLDDTQLTPLASKTMVTTEDVKAMLDIANYNAEQAELKRKEKEQMEEQEQEDDDDKAEEEGVVTGLFNWAWNSLVGEPEEGEIGVPVKEDHGERSRLVRSFNVIGVRMDSVSLDFLLHVRGHKESDRGPLHLRYPRLNTINREDPEQATKVTKTKMPVPSRSRVSSETATCDDGDSVVRRNATKDINTTTTTAMESISSPTLSPQRLVKVRTPGGYVEVDMSENGPLSQQHDETTSYSTVQYHPSSAERRFDRTSSLSSSASMQSSTYVTRDGYRKRKSRERVEAFASLQFSGIEYEMRTHSLRVEESRGMRDNDIVDKPRSTTNENEEHGTFSSGSSTLDSLTLFEIRSVGMWSSMEMTKTINIEIEHGKQVILPNYLLLCGACALHDCDSARGAHQTRLSSLSTASLSPPPSPALLGITSPVLGSSPGILPPMRLSGSLGHSHHSISSPRSLLRTPPNHPTTTPASSSSSSSASASSSSSQRRSSAAWLEWIAHPFLPRRIGLNLPPPKNDLPPFSDIVNNDGVPGAGRALRMVMSVTSEEKSDNIFKVNSKTEVSIGQATLRLDPEWIADMRVVMQPMFEGNSSEGKREEMANENKVNKEINKIAEKDKADEVAPTKNVENEAVSPTIATMKKMTNNATNIQVEGIGIWMVLEGQTSDKEEMKEEVEERPASWCLIESSRCSSSSNVTSGATPSIKDWSYKFDHVCLCTGQLESSVGETGFHRGLAEQLSAFHLRQQQYKYDTPKFWQLQSTGLFRSDHTRSMEEMRLNKWPTYTLSATNDGAPVLSKRKDVLTVSNVVVSKDCNDSSVSLERGGQWQLHVDASNVPFLTACYNALFGMGNAYIDDDMLYWISMVERMGTNGNGNTCSSSVDGGGSGTRTNDGSLRVTPREEEEVARLRVLLQEARQEAEKWKALVENSLSQ